MRALFCDSNSFSLSLIAFLKYIGAFAACIPIERERVCVCARAWEGNTFYVGMRHALNHGRLGKKKEGLERMLHTYTCRERERERERAYTYAGVRHALKPHEKKKRQTKK